MLDLGTFFSSASRRTVLKGSAIGIVVYSIIVLIYSNLVPDLGIDAFDRVVGRVSVVPVLGKTPEQGDRLVSIAGMLIDTLPRYVNTIGYLRHEHRFPAAQLNDLSELAQTEQSIVEAAGKRYVRLRFTAKAEPHEPFDSWFEVRDMPWQTSAFSIVWFAVDSLIFWLGWLVFRNRPEDDSVAMFFLMCIVTVGAYMGGYHWLQIAGSPALTFVFALCAMALPQVMLHFYLIFPSPKRWLLAHPRATMLLLYGAPGILQIAILWTIGSVVSVFRHEQPVNEISGYVRLLGWLSLGYLVLAALMLLGCVASLVHSYWTARQAIHRVQVRWILTGAGLASIFITYSFWLAIDRPADFALGGARWSMFGASLMMTLAYAISIGRYRLLHVEEILQRGVLYVAISFAGGVCYYGLLLLTIWVSPRLAAETSQGQALLIATFVMLVLLSLSTIRSRIQLLLDRKFYREKHQLERAMRQMDEAVGKLVDRKTLLRRCLFVATDVLNARDGAIYYRSPDDRFSLGHETGGRKFPTGFNPSHELIEELRTNALLQVSPGPTLTRGAADAVLRRLRVEIALSFRIDQMLVGFLLLGPKNDNLYNSEDLQFLSGLADITALALHAAESQSTLELLNEELREKVARISHQQQQLMALQSQSQRRRPESTEDGRPLDLDLIRGAGPAVQAMISTVAKVAASQSTVLIRGESGTGKTLLAEAIHRNSSRANGPFVKVHCAALSPSLLESELFGHVRGAFTGAHRDKIGRFQLADRGTLFLDEVGDLSLDIQTKLLRVLQERTFEAVGSSESMSVDVRIIAATHQPLEELIRRGRFREDLFYRLNVISIRTPALRERTEDIFELAIHFLRKYAARAKADIEGIDPEAMRILSSYSWPGNIRELENVIERAAVLASSPMISPVDLPAELLGIPNRVLAPIGMSAPYAESTDRSLAESESHSVWRPTSGAASWRTTADSANSAGLSGELDEIERQRLIDALRAGGGNKSKAAKLLGIPRSTFCSKLKKFNMG